MKKRYLKCCCFVTQQWKEAETAQSPLRTVANLKYGSVTHQCRLVCSTILLVILSSIGMSGGWA
jgi:hypothetical protein